MTSKKPSTSATPPVPGNPDTTEWLLTSKPRRRLDPDEAVGMSEMRIVLHIAETECSGVCRGRTYSRDELKAAAGIGNDTLDAYIRAGLRILPTTLERGQAFLGDDWIDALLQVAVALERTNKIDVKAFQQDHEQQASKRSARRDAEKNRDKTTI